MAAVVEAEGLVVDPDQSGPGWSFALGEGLSLLRGGREGFHTLLSLVLAGRAKPHGGMLRVAAPDGRELKTPRALFKEVALAGVPQLDSLEREVAVRTVLREQLAWSLPFYRWVPRNVASHPRVAAALEAAGIEPDLDGKVGSLHPLDRLSLRVALALVARPEAALLVVDDVDQLRDLELRDEALRRLSRLAHRLPVVALSVNGDPAGIAARVIDLRGEGDEPGDDAEPAAAGEGRHAK